MGSPKLDEHPSGAFVVLPCDAAMADAVFPRDFATLVYAGRRKDAYSKRAETHYEAHGLAPLSSTQLAVEIGVHKPKRATPQSTGNDPSHNGLKASLGSDQSPVITEIPGPNACKRRAISWRISSG